MVSLCIHETSSRDERMRFANHLNGAPRPKNASSDCHEKAHGALLWKCTYRLKVFLVRNGCPAKEQQDYAKDNSWMTPWKTGSERHG